MCQICGSWEKKNAEGGWNTVNTGTFTEGTYRFYVQMRIDGSGGSTHKLAKPVTSVKVNGTDWVVDASTFVYGTYSYTWVKSPEFVITAPEGQELTFYDSSSFDIKTIFVGTEITPVDVSSEVDGGTKPYTFSKISGPDWISVSSTGEISGTPTAIGTNEDLVVRVTDSLEAYKEITISVDYTRMNPSDRETISAIEGTSTDIDTIAGYGKEIQMPTITTTTGMPAYFDVSNMRFVGKEKCRRWMEFSEYWHIYRRNI